MIYYLVYLNYFILALIAALALSYHFVTMNFVFV